MRNTKSSKVIFNIAAILIFSLVELYGQSPEMLWETFYDGSLSGNDTAEDIITDDLNNIYITGKSYHSYYGGDFTTIKINNNGELQWADHFSNTQPGYSNYGRRLVLDKWKNIYSAGTTALNDGDLTVIKYNDSGRVWAKSYEPYWFSTYDDFGIDIDVDSSGNFYALARVTSPDGNLYDMYIMKCDSGGNKLWDVNYTGASGADYPVDIEVTPAGTVYTLLQQFNFFGSATPDISTFQYTTEGILNWFSNYDGPGNAEDYPVNMKVDDAENQYVCGTTFSGTDDDMVIIRQNLYGTRLWVVSYNGTANGNDTAISIDILPNGFTAVTGIGKELSGSSVVDAIVTMVIDSGTVLWTNKFYGTDDLGAVPYEMLTDAYGNIYVCGSEILEGGYTNAVLIKYDSSGNLIWNISYDGGSNLNDVFTSLTLNSEGEIIAAGQTYTSPGNSNLLAVKYRDIVTGVSPDVNIVKEFSLEQNYPNPFNPATTIRFSTPAAADVHLKVYDILGNEVASLVNEYKPAGTYEIEFNASKLSSGVYLYQLNSGEYIQINKMILMK